LEGGPPSFSPRFTGADLLRNACGRPCDFAYGTVALCGARFHTLRLSHDFVTPAGPTTIRTRRPTTPDAQRVVAFRRAGFGLFPFRSPLLRESQLISFPRGTEMFHFPRLSSPRLCVQRRITSHYRRWVSPFGHPRVTGHSAPHRGLSQPFTPFIDSWCQGIHHVPLLS
jgi:hypothetical protein